MIPANKSLNSLVNDNVMTFRRIAGFTLLELVIVIAIVAVLAAVAYPSYENQVRKGRRADAISLLSDVQQAQERWRANNAAYTSTIGSGGLLGIGSSNYYTIGTAAGPIGGVGLASNTYSVTAQAQGSQTADTGCQVLEFRSVVGTPSHWAGTSVGTLANAASDATAARCWAR
jgi:type IV pilus assembly protein PilE